MFAEYKEMNFLDQGNYLDKKQAFITLFSSGVLKFNGTLARWMELHKKKCVKIGHNSTNEKPDLTTQIFIVANNEPPSKINFPIQRINSSGNKYSSISCKRAIAQISSLVAISNERDVEKRRLKIEFCPKTNVFFHNLIPQLSSEINIVNIGKLPEVSSIYALVKGITTTYIGITNNLLSRAKDHVKSVEKDFDYIKFSELKDSPIVRKHYERLLLDRHIAIFGELPRYNKVLPEKVDISLLDITNSEKEIKSA